MAVEMNFEELVPRARDGDAKALEQLLRECEPAMARLAARVCPARDADDAVQEVLFRMSDKIGGLRVAGAFLSWGMKMVVRECFAFKRRALRLVFQDAERQVHSPSEERLELQRALNRISERSREILLHRDLLERTAPETAQSLQITVESAKSRLRRARAELRAVLSTEA